MQAAANSSQAVQFGKEWQGQTVDGRYPLYQYLGGSDKSAVFLTRLPADVRTRAAIKLVRAAGREAETLLSNWKRAAQLSHPHLLRVFDGGRCWLSGQEMLYVVVECADENLAQVLPQRALSASEVDAMLRPALSALAYLHDEGLVHGYLRPSNVMAVGEQVKLSIDCIEGADATQDKTQLSGYDAPELAAGQFSPAADVWSLGITLVECLTQHTPRDKKDVAGLPQPFAEIVRHSLMKDPSTRWTVGDIAEAIHLRLPASKTNKPVPEKAYEVAPIVPATGRGSRRILGLVLFLVVAAILAIVLGVRLLHHGPAPAAQKEAALSASENPPKISSRPALPNQPGSVLHQVLPNASAGALGTIQGHVRVRLRVKADASGNVADAQFVAAGPSHYFARVSMEAAQQWKFRPPVANGQATASEWDVLFVFAPDGVRAFPEQASSAR